MPIIKSAIKRVRKTKRQTKANLVTKNKFKKLIKNFQTLVSEKKLEEAAKLFPSIQKEIDLGAKKNVLHRNTAARKKSQLAKLIRNVNIAGLRAVAKVSEPKAEKSAPKAVAKAKKTTKSKK